MGNAPDRFGPFTFDRRQRMLVRKDGNVLPVGGRGAALLGALIDARGQLVEKDALISAAWPDVIVEDGNLTVQIAALRKALGSKPDGTDWIVTVRQLGYRLVTGEAIGSEAGGAGRPAVAVVPAANLGSNPEQEFVTALPRLTVAVWPFETLSSNPSEGSFARGLTADLAAALCKIPEITVLAEPADHSTDGESDDASARYAIQGTLQWSGDAVRVTARLSDASGRQVWAGRFQRETKSFFALQDEIIQSILVAFESKLTSGDMARIDSRGTTNLEAWLLRVEAEGEVWKFTRASTNRARELYAAARDLDPLWSVPWGALAWASWRDAKEGWTESREDSIAEGIAFAERSIELGPREPMGYMQLGNLLQLRGEHERAIELRERAVELAPSDFGALCGLGSVLIAAGHPVRALQVLRKAAEVAPRYPASLCALTAIAHLVAEDNQAALTMARQAIARRFENTGPYAVSAIALVALGRNDEAKQAVQAAQQLDPHYRVGNWVAAQGNFKDRSLVERLSGLLAAAGLPP
jgi:TolB-like protein/DNA-binding winged helix-turn-helix (wHTH) protein/Flp pilus assembly protein TadD